MRPADHFKIASLTKTYTATVVLQLVAEGKLRLADSVERWLPGLVPNGEAITIRHLLTTPAASSTTRPTRACLEPYLAGDLGFFWAPRSSSRSPSRTRRCSRPADTTSSYSNTNYVLAGLVVEAVTGQLDRRRAAQPDLPAAPADDTHLPDDEPRLPAPYAHGYMVLGEPRRVDVTGLSPSLSPASGAIVSTAATSPTSTGRCSPAACCRRSCCGR